MDKNEFDIDFDFEKEYGFDPDMLLNADAEFNDADFDEFRDVQEPAVQPEPEFVPEAPAEDAFEDFGLDEDMPAGFQMNAADFDLTPEDFGAVEDNMTPELFSEEVPVAFSLPGVRGEYDENMEPNQDIPVQGPFPVVPEPFGEAPIAPAGQPGSPDAPPQNPRRRKRSKMRVFKEVYLPAIIAGVALILILSFVIGAIVNAVKRGKLEDEAEQNVSESQENEQQRLYREAQQVLAEAAALAAGYDYEAAITKLESFSGDMTAYQEMISAKSSYAQLQNQLVEHRDPSLIPNLSFHVLIADPSRAFTDEEFGGQYNRNFVTTDEFSKILQQLYDNGYVLVDYDSFLDKNTGVDGEDSYFSKPIYLPADKKPIMITETMVNYFNYMIDSDNDGQYGDGFASRLVVTEDGEIKAEMQDASGNTVVGDYDLVPILESFIAEHPDFSYRGARATLAVTGHEGVFGYRINTAVQSTEGQAYYDEQVAGAKTVVQALRDKGYTIACFTYSNQDYYKYTAAQVTTEMQNWTSQIVPVIGEVDVLVYARESDIREYTGTKYEALYDAGFRIFVGKGAEPTAEINGSYVRQERLMVTGNTMAWSSTAFSRYFDSKAILNSLRGNVPN